MKKNIKEILIQIIPVMIGVYLGFLVTNWSTRKQEKARSEFLVENIIKEIEINEKLLKNVIEYHTMLRDSSRYYSREVVEFNKPQFFEGTRIIKLSNSAYNTGIQTGIINELPLDKIQSINQLYTYQNDYNEFGNLIMASVLNFDLSDNPNDMKKIARFLSVTMTDIAIKENDLIEGFRKVKLKLQNE